MANKEGRRGSTVVCACCGGPAPIRGENDEWEGRLDGYCENCALQRCDAYPGECKPFPLRWEND